MVEQPDKWRVFYYSDDEGHVPVREWLETLDDTAVARIFRAIDLLREHGVNLGTDYSRQVRGKSSSYASDQPISPCVFCTSQ